jgi:hypothetical protein
VTLHGTLYEITNFASFLRTYVMDSRRPDPDSVRPIKDGQVTFCYEEETGSESPLLLQCRTDDTGRFEVDLSRAPDAPLFVAAAGPEQQPDNYWYRSACVRPAAFDQHAQEIYVARATIPAESGFSQVDLAGLLERMKKQVADLERITGRITGSGITLSGSGKGATASVTVLLQPDRTGDLATFMRHAITNFRLDLPGPTWLTGLLVSRDAVEKSIHAGVRNLAVQINEQLRIRAIETFTNQVAENDRALAAKLAGTATLTMERLRYPLVAHQGGASGGDRTIAGDVCLGFSQTLQPEEPG